MFLDGGEVYVDDNDTPLEANADYTSRAGSTIITLTSDYISTLSEGEHTLKVVFNDDNVATTSFTVTKDSSSEETSNDVEELPPQTGIDNSKNVSLVIIILMLLLNIIKF